MELDRDEEIIQWVNKLKSVIKAKTAVYALFAPYDLEDYMSIAHEAALIASKICPDIKNELYSRIFWRLFKDSIAELVPYPPEDDIDDPGENEPIKRRVVRTNHSMSIPVNRYVADEIFDYERPIVGFEFTEREEAYSFLINIVIPELTACQNHVLELAAGISDNNKLSQREIAKVLGISRAAVRDRLDRIYKKASKFQRTFKGASGDGNHDDQ